jgi:hypothetical protein
MCLSFLSALPFLGGHVMLTCSRWLMPWWSVILFGDAQGVRQQHLPSRSRHQISRRKVSGKHASLATVLSLRSLLMRTSVAVLLCCARAPRLQDGCNQVSDDVRGAEEYRARRPTAGSCLLWDGGQAHAQQNTRQTPLGVRPGLSRTRIFALDSDPAGTELISRVGTSGAW